MKITTKRSLLALSITLLSSPIYALELLEDDVLSEVTAQDGISLHSVASLVKMDKLYWQDDGKELQMRDINLTNWDSTTELDFGANSDLASATPAMSISTVIKPFLLTVGSIGVCNAGSTCTETFGEFALETTTDSRFSFFNTNGFFDGSSSNGRFRFNVSKANVYFAQTFAGKRNLGILKDLTLNGSINGKFTVDANEGLRTQGTLSLNKNNTTHTHGLQFDIAHKGDQASGFNTTGSNTIARFGISGNILNYDAKMKADNSLVTGLANTQGIKLNLSGYLDKNNFQMEVGNPLTYSVIFKDWVDFADGAAVVPSNPYFSFGDIYLNTVAATGTLPNFTLGYGNGFGQITAAGDAIGLAVRGLSFQAYPKTLVFQDNTTFAQTTQNWSLISALYNLDANALFYSGGHPSLGAAKRGIGFDLSMATTGRDTTPGKEGTQGTHILVADPDEGTYFGFRNLDARVQLNQGQFYITDLATDGINGFAVTSNDMKFDLSGELAVGSLPNGSSITAIRDDDELFGVRIRAEGKLNLAVAAPPEGGYVPVLTIPILNILVGLGVNGSFTIVDPDATWHSDPAMHSGKTLDERFVLPDPNGLRNSFVITEPADGTELQFADLGGTLTIRQEHIKKGEFTGANKTSLGVTTLGNTILGGDTTDDFTDVSRVEAGNNVATFGIALQFGNRKGTEATNPNDVFRIGDVVLGFDNDAIRGNAIPEANRFRLGEIVFTGGRLYTEVSIKPQIP